jgi:hypothetical protein
MAGAGLLWEKSTAGWLLVTDLFWDKSTVGWWLISQANRLMNAVSCTYSLQISLGCNCPWTSVMLLFFPWNKTVWLMLTTGETLQERKNHRVLMWKILNTCIIALTFGATINSNPQYNIFFSYICNNYQLSLAINKACWKFSLLVHVAFWKCYYIFRRKPSTFSEDMCIVAYHLTWSYNWLNYFVLLSLLMWYRIT